MDRGDILTDVERKNMHVLVVEDNAINQQIAIKTIKKIGFSVSAVWNGQEALDYLLSKPPADGSAPPTKPDIILMDCQMPILDGYRSTYIIRNEEPYASIPGMRVIPIVAMTASAIRGDREKCSEAGMDDYLAKPVKAKNLEQMLVKWALNIKKGRISSTRGSGSNEGSADSDLLAAGLEPSPPVHSVPVSPGSVASPAPTFPFKAADPVTPSKARPKHRSTATMTGSMPFNNTEAFSFDTKKTSRNTSQHEIPPRFSHADANLENHLVRATSGMLGDDNSRGMQRVEAEEKATSLRNDKLIRTADETHPDHQERIKSQHHHHPIDGLRTLQDLSEKESSNDSVYQLTEENVGRWEREHGGGASTKGDQSSAPESSPERDLERRVGAQSLDVDGSLDVNRDSQAPTPESRQARAGMVRMESQMTVTPRRTQVMRTNTGSEGE